MELHEAIGLYLPDRLDPTALPTGNPTADLLTALQRAAMWRQEGPKATTAVLRAAHHDLGLSYRTIERLSLHVPTGARIAHSTAEAIINAAGKR